MRGVLEIIPGPVLILIGLAVAAIVVGVLLSALFAYEFEGVPTARDLLEREAARPLPPMRWGQPAAFMVRSERTRTEWDRMCVGMWELLVAGEINWTEPIRPGSVGFYDQEAHQ